MLPKVLIVDDEPNVTGAMKNTLRRQRYEVLCAGSAREAWDILQHKPVDVMIVDEQMPGMLGSELLVKVRREYPEIIRIMLTGHATREGIMRAVNEGQIYRFLEKPCHSLDLVITIRSALQYKELMAKSGALLRAASQQSALWQDMERKHPDIARQPKGCLASDAENLSGAELDSLLASIDAQAKKIASFLGMTNEASVLQESKTPTACDAPDRQEVRRTAPSTVPVGGESTGAEQHDGNSPPLVTSDATASPKAQGEPMRQDTSEFRLEGVQSVKDLKPIMTRSEIQECLDNCSELKGMSPTVVQILKITQSSQCSMDQVVKVVKQDHAVSLKILKIANSVAYTHGEPVDTVQKAIMRIGLTQLRQAVLNISVVDQFSGEDQVTQLSTPQFWEHSIATGLITAEITHALSDKTAKLDIAFTMGLLHDIGRIIYLEILGEKYQHVLKAAKALQVPLEQVESRMLLINHADAMDRILHKWKFPKDLVNPIALHQLSLGNIRRMAPNAINEVATLALANRLAHALLIGSSGNLSLYPTEEFVSILRLKPDVIKRIEEEIPSQTDDIKFSMLASSNQQAWPRLRDELTEKLEQPFWPLHVSMEPNFDALRIFCDRLRDNTEEEPPNVGIIHIKKGRERAPVTSEFLKAEAEAGAGPLPLIILSPKGDITLEDKAMAKRRFELLHFPVSISRFIGVFNALASRLPPGEENQK